MGGNELLYRTRLEITAIRVLGNDVIGANRPVKKKKNQECIFAVHAAIGGVVKKTERSMVGPSSGLTTHCWEHGNVLVFDTRSSWGRPKTLSLRVSSVSFDDNGISQIGHKDDKGVIHYSSEEGYCWLDLTGLAVESNVENPDSNGRSSSASHVINILPFDGDVFDQQGFPSEMNMSPQRMEIELNVTTETIKLGGDMPSRCLLLYKHDDDMRQEMLAIDFIEACDRILRASGLDLKLRTFRCLAVGNNCGFIEWVSGTAPLSEICKPLGCSNRGGSESSNQNAKTAVSKDEKDDDSERSLQRVSKDWCKYESLRDLRQRSSTKSFGTGGASVYIDNPIQDFLRSNAYDADAPYFIRKEVMDNYIKSCAGYSIITYLLGVGDRHLDNLLLHVNGHFLHCDYSFILGRDPKTYLPLRITEDMVLGMGGRDSDNFSKFLSIAGVAFVSLRRHNNVRILMALLRNMAYSKLPDISKNQNAGGALMAMHDRFRLDLSEEDSISFIEKLIEKSISSKIWIAVDTMHSLGKRF